MSKQNLEFIYKYTKPFIGFWLLGFSFTIIASFIQIKYSWLIQKLIDNALLPKDFNLLLKLCIQFFLLVIICSILSFTKELCFNYVSQRSIINMRLDLFQHILRLPYEYFVKTDDGDIVNTIINDIKNTQDTFSNYIVSLITSFISSVFIIMWLMIVNWKLSILFLIVVPIFCFVTKKMWGIINKLSHKMSEKIGELTGFLQEVVSSITIIKMSDDEFFVNRLAKICKDLAENIIKFRLSNAFNNSLWESILTPYQAIFYLIGGFWYIKYNEPSIGTMLVFVNLVGVLIPNVLTFLDSISFMANGVASLDRIQKVFDQPVEQSGKKLLSTADSISMQFNDVKFGYKNTNFALDGINLFLKSGDFVTIVGQTGSGKSTLLKLLVRLYDVDAGEITINGIDIKEYDIKDLRKCFGFLQQEMYLVKGTLKENLMIANEHATDAQINKVIQMVHLDKLVKRLPKQIYTEVGERGIALSGGEKQRLSLARMLINHLNHIVIMDEPTSALDFETEQGILKDINPVLKGKMTIVIDHRLATLNYATKVIVMKEGIITETGTYDELMKAKGELYELIGTHIKK